MARIHPVSEEREHIAKLGNLVTHNTNMATIGWYAYLILHCWPPQKQQQQHKHCDDNRHGCTNAQKESRSAPPPLHIMIPLGAPHVWIHIASKTRVSVAKTQEFGLCSWSLLRTRLGFGDESSSGTPARRLFEEWPRGIFSTSWALQHKCIHTLVVLLQSEELLIGKPTLSRRLLCCDCSVHTDM